MPPEQAPKPTDHERTTPSTANRSDGLTVRTYLEGLRMVASGGHRCSRGTMERRVAAIDDELATANPRRHQTLLQQRHDLQVEIERIGRPVDIDALEAAFVDIAKCYSDRHRFSYQSWREVGVPATVLAHAGITPDP